MATPKKPELHPSFTFDPETTAAGEIPSITRLLNRKKSSEPNTYPGAHQAPVQRTQAAVPTPKAPVQPTVRVAGRRQKNITQTPEKTLTEWNSEALKSKNDSSGQMIRKAVAAGGNTALWFAAQQPTGVFTAQAFFGDSSRCSLWAGMVWNPQTFPTLMQTLQKQGCIALSVTAATAPEVALIRKVTGTRETECLNVALIPGQGVLLLFSEKSLEEVLRPFYRSPDRAAA